MAACPTRAAAERPRRRSCAATAWAERSPRATREPPRAPAGQSGCGGAEGGRAGRPRTAPLRRAPSAHLASSPPPPRRLGTGPGPLRALIGRPPGPVTWEGGARSPQPPGRHFGWKVWNFRALRAGGGGGARPALPGPYQPPRARPAASPTRPAPRGGSPERSRREGRSVARRGGGSGGAVPPRPAGRGCAPPPRAGSGSKFARRSRHARQEAR